jgi:hypothetical protein
MRPQHIALPGASNLAIIQAAKLGIDQEICMEASISRLRPLNLGDILDTVFLLYRRNFLTFIGAVALVQIPLLLLQLALTMALGEDFMRDWMELAGDLPFFNPQTDSFSELPLSNIVAFYGMTVLLSLLQAWVVLPLIYGSVTYATEQSYRRGESVSILGAYSFGGGKIVALIVNAILISIITTLLYVIPLGLILGLMFFVGSASQGDSAVGMILVLSLVLLLAVVVVSLLVLVISVLFLFAPPAIVLEGYGPLAALGRSWQMVTSSLGRIVGYVIVMGLLMLIIWLIPSMIFGGIIGVIFNDPIGDFTIQQSLSAIVGNITYILIWPLWYIAATVLYYDVRVRKEGYDLQLAVEPDALTSNA